LFEEIATYKDLFDDNTILHKWLVEGIIKRMLAHEAINNLLPSTQTCPQEKRNCFVFNASVKIKDSPSFNQCSETGSNFIEPISTLLHRFRE